MNDKIMEIFKNLQNSKKVELTTEQKNHVYETEGKFHTDFLGDLILSFNNNKYWYYNKDIELQLKVTNNRLVDICEINNNNSLSKITRIVDNENKFIINNITNTIDLKISLNSNDTVEWSFKVLDNHSIDFDMSFNYNNLEILNNIFIELNELRNYRTSHELYICDLHKKIENQKNNIENNEFIIRDLNKDIISKNKIIDNQKNSLKDNERIIKELNTIIKDKDKAIINKDILINKKEIFNKQLVNTNNDLNNKLINKNKVNDDFKKVNYSYVQPIIEPKPIQNPQQNPIQFSSKYNNIDSWNTFFGPPTNKNQYNNKNNNLNYW